MRSHIEKIGLVGMGLVAGVLISLHLSAVAEKDSYTTLPVEELRALSEVFGRVKSDYVEPVSDKKLITEAISPGVFVNWRFNAGAVKTIPLAEVSALVEGTPWRPRPVTLHKGCTRHVSATGEGFRYCVVPQAAVLGTCGGCRVRSSTWSGS